MFTSLAASDPAALPLWLQISLALAAPSVALLVGFLSVRQQNRALLLDREMRAREHRNLRLANAITVFSRVDNSIERLRAATIVGTADPKTLATEIREVVHGQDEVMTAEAELQLAIPRNSLLGHLALVVASNIQELAVNIREPPSTGKELFDLVEQTGEGFQEAMYAFIEEARAVALGGPIQPEPPLDSPDSN